VQVSNRRKDSFGVRADKQGGQDQSMNDLRSNTKALRFRSSPRLISPRQKKKVLVDYIKDIIDSSIG